MFRLWREFREYRRAKAIVGTAVGEDRSRRKSMAQLTGQGGYMIVKMALIEAAMSDMAGTGNGRYAPGLSLAVGVLARCEAVANDEAERMREEREPDEPV